MLTTRNVFGWCCEAAWHHPEFGLCSPSLCDLGPKHRTKHGGIVYWKNTAIPGIIGVFPVVSGFHVTSRSREVFQLLFSKVEMTRRAASLLWGSRAEQMSTVVLTAGQDLANKSDNKCVQVKVVKVHLFSYPEPWDTAYWWENLDAKRFLK